MSGIERISSKDNEGIYHKLDIIVIDEVSMVRADLLDCVDRFLRLNGPEPNKPFGGIQMAFIGDLYQLPPVVTGGEKEVFQSLYETPYFYGARVFESFEMEFVELEKIYRQHDEGFITLLNGIRNNSVTEEGLELLNERYQPEFEPPPDDFYVYLTTTNRLAEEINGKRLAVLKGRLYTFTGSIQGDFAQGYLPTAVDIQLKVGAQIMMLNNDTDGNCPWMRKSKTLPAGVSLTYTDTDDGMNWEGTIPFSVLGMSAGDTFGYMFAARIKINAKKYVDGYPEMVYGSTPGWDLRDYNTATIPPPTKADILKESGIPGKGLSEAPGLQKPFNPKSKAGEHAGK